MTPPSDQHPQIPTPNPVDHLEAARMTFKDWCRRQRFLEAREVREQFIRESTAALIRRVQRNPAKIHYGYQSTRKP